MVSSEVRSLAYSQCDQVSIKVAATRDERQGAFRLTYNSYLSAGLCNPCEIGLRMTPYQLLPSTDVLVAELRGEVISTVSLVRDGELGLPLEAIYPEEVRQRRAVGLRLAEVSSLADRRRDALRYFDLFSELARLILQMADREGIDQLLIAVHPRHAGIYRRALAFEKVGTDRDYPAVNGHPAVMLSLEMELIRTRRLDVWQRFVREPLPEPIVRARPICEVDRSYFAKLAEGVQEAERLCPPPPAFVGEHGREELACA